MILRLLIFLTLNFTALGIGAILMGEGPSSIWYESLNKAPWTPPGWVFGAAWTSIMIGFSIFMTYLWDVQENKKYIIGLYILQWILNVGWNPLFFYFHMDFISLIEILILLALVAYFTFGFYMDMKFKILLSLPYFIWLIIASSLNFYVFWYN